MTRGTDVYVVSSPGPKRDAVVARLGQPVEGVFDSVEAFLVETRVDLPHGQESAPKFGEAPLFNPPKPSELSGTTTHLVLLGADVSPEQTLRLVRAVAERHGTWVPVVLEDEGSGGDPVARTLSVGFPLVLDELLTRVDEAEKPILELRSVLRFISRARHDINNPLTSGLAETQLLLMDVEEGEIRESLEVIQDQLRRIRDLVAALSVLKQPTN
ncbi:MAG: histidine kinase dimerization/phospho-acceptor domain-containing protein [Longimicrobiales bacterium]